MKHAVRTVVPFMCWMFFALGLLGCAAPMTERHASWSLLPSSAEVEADAARLAIPPPLRARLNAIAAKSCNATTRPDPRHVGQTYRDPLGEIRDRMLIAILKWSVEKASEKSPEEQAAQLQTRQMMPLPLLQVRPPSTATEGETPLTLDDPRVQFGAGAVAGGSIGAVPFGPMGAEIGIELRLLPKGTYWARVGKACGEIVVGTGQIILGCTGMSAGAGISGTGGGAVVGVPVMSGSIMIAANGCATASHGLAELHQLWREGDDASGSSAPAAQSEVVLEPKAKPAKPAPAAETTPAVKPTSTPPTKTTTTTRVKKAEPAQLEPYSGPGGGHHVPAKKAFEGAPGYDPKKALAIPNAELDKLGIKHAIITAFQRQRYKAFAETGQPLTWEAVAKIETEALTAAKMNLDVAQATVAKAIKALKDAGVSAPVRIPWGKK